MTLQRADSDRRPAWEVIQAKTFTKWCNMYLKRSNFKTIKPPINLAFRNGIKLMQLVNALYGVQMPKKYTSAKRCTMRPMMLDNVNIALKMLEEADVKTNYLKNVNILDGDWKMMLGMVWAIIIDFNLKGIDQEGSKNAKEGLLIWCRKKTKGYKKVDGNINNFSSSWQNGLAFAALVNRHFPNMMQYDPDAKDEDVLEEAFAVCEQLGVERLLDIEDLVSVIKPDEKSVMTYVSELYKVFSKTDMKEKSAKHIKTFIKFNRDIRALQSEYEERAKRWREGCNSHIKEFKEYKQAENITEATGVLNSYKTYVKDMQPALIVEKIELEQLYTNIQSELKVNKRVPYKCEISLQDLDTTWKDLTTAQNEHYHKSRDTRFKFVEAIKPDSVTKEQIDEWNDAFSHFDENKNDYLEFDELSAALKAIGVPLTEDDEKSTFRDLHITVDGVGCVQRDAFIQYLEKFFTADDTADSVLASMEQLAKSESVRMNDLMIQPLDDQDREFLENNCPKSPDGNYDFATFTKEQFQ